MLTTATVASTVLFVVAKRRQWDVRASFARASRRLTGRGGDGSKTPRTPKKSGFTKQDERTVKRDGIRLENRSREDARREEGHKRGLVVQVKDLEKGDGTVRQRTPVQDSAWKSRLFGNDWK